MPSTIITEEMVASHGAWLRRIARALLQPAADADDLAADTWIAAVEKPPDRSWDLRSWLYRVAANRSKNRRRDAFRRAAGEQAAGSQDDRSPISPEVSASLAELQRLLAQLVVELEEPYRSTIQMRYFEDLEPTEIARRLGIPAGTVRWRLKTAIEKLRQALDEKHDGHRNSWRALIAPLAVLPSIEPRKAWRKVAAVALSLGALALIGVGLNALRSDSSLRAVDGPRRKTDNDEAPSRIAPRSTLVAATGSTPENIAECPALASMVERLETRRKEITSHGHPMAAFKYADRNRSAETKFSTIYRPGVDDRCEINIECRGRICQVELLVPDELKLDVWKACFPRSDRGELIPEIRPYLHRSLPVGMNSGVPVHDPVAGRSFHKWQLWYGLHSEAVELTPKEQPSPEVPIMNGLRSAVVVPSPLAHHCQGLAWELERQIYIVERDLAEALPPGKAFAVSPPTNNTLQPAVVSEIASILGLDAGDLPLRITCRDTLCSVRATDQMPRALRLTFRCQEDSEATKPHCAADHESDSWFRRLYRGDYQPSRIIANALPSVGDDEESTTVYLRIREPSVWNRDDPMTVVCKIAGEVERARLLPECQAQHNDTSGTLRIALQLDREGGTAAFTIHEGGTLAGTSLGNCVVSALREFLSHTDVPATRDDFVLYSNIEFPGATTFWKGSCKD